MAILSKIFDYSSDVVSTVTEHRHIITASLVAAPIVYYGGQFVYWYVSMRPVWKVVEDNFDGPKKHWLYGNLHQHPGPGPEGVKFMKHLTQKYPTGFLTWMTPLKPVLSLVHPNCIKEVLKSTQPKARSFLGAYRLIFPWIGDGLLLSSGDKWFRNRRLLTPAFHFDVLKPYIDVYNEAVDIFLDKLTKLSSRDMVEIYTPVNLLTLNVILRCAFSYDKNVQEEGENNEYVNAVVVIANKVVQRLFKPWLTSDWVYELTREGKEFNAKVRFAHDVSKQLIDKRKQYLEDNAYQVDKRYKDFLDILLLAKDEDGSGLTDEEIRDEVDTFLFEGHDTTASAISWILYSFAQHPEIQEKARKEIDEFYEDKETEHMTWDDLNNIPYVTLCIKEAIRIHSPVPFIARETDSPIKVNGVELKPGTMIDIVIFCLHHNKSVWGNDHEEFKPERFLKENLKDMDSFAFIPFSAGPRNCIGQNFAMHEIKVAVCRTLRCFKLETIPDKPALYNPELVMRAKGGMYVKLTPRKGI